MERTSTEDQDHNARDSDTGGVAGTNIPDGHNPARGTGTPDGTDTGFTGVIRTSASPGETGGYGATEIPGDADEDADGITGGYGTGGVDPKEQSEEKA